MSPPQLENVSPPHGAGAKDALSSLRNAAVAVAGAGVVPVESRDRWILIDDFESQGRRYLIAQLAPSTKENPSDLFPISTPELLVVAKRANGQSLKAIALDLGLPPSTVSSALLRISKGLGAARAARLLGTRRGYKSLPTNA